MHPDAPYIKRQGEVDAWDNADFRQAVEATGKKQIIIGGITTDVSLHTFHPSSGDETLTALHRDVDSDRYALRSWRCRSARPATPCTPTAMPLGRSTSGLLRTRTTACAPLGCTSSRCSRSRASSCAIGATRLVLRSSCRSSTSECFAWISYESSCDTGLGN